MTTTKMPIDKKKDDGSKKSHSSAATFVGVGAAKLEKFHPRHQQHHSYSDNNERRSSHQTNVDDDDEIRRRRSSAFVDAASETKSPTTSLVITVKTTLANHRTRVSDILESWWPANDDTKQNVSKLIREQLELFEARF